MLPSLACKKLDAMENLVLEYIEYRFSKVPLSSMEKLNVSVFLWRGKKGDIHKTFGKSFFKSRYTSPLISKKYVKFCSETSFIHKTKCLPLRFNPGWNSIYLMIPWAYKSVSWWSVMFHFITGNIREVKAYFQPNDSKKSSCYCVCF